MKTFVAFIANYELNVVVLEIFLTDFACHILKTLVPLFSTYVSRSQTQITLAFFGAAEALGKGRAVDIELVVEGEFFILHNVSEGEDANADFSEHIPLLGDAVGLAGVVDEPSEVALVCGVDNLALGSLHEVGAG
jgi:hypothetical protein